MDSEKATPSFPLSPVPGNHFSQRALKLERDLSQLFFDLLEKKRASGVVPSVPDRFPLHLKLELFAGGSVKGPPDQLLEEIQRAVERWVSRTTAFPYGRIYCHWCQSFTCNHSMPPEPRDVFAGYSSTGQPIWRELAAVLLERRDPRIENVYREAASPVTLVQAGSELTLKQLTIYGKNSPIYRLLGQVTLGYVPLQGQAGPRSGVAITFQVVELAGGQRLVLNVLGKLASGRPTFQALEEAADPRLQNALLASQRNLAELSLRRFPRRRRDAERRRHAMAILQRLAQQLDRIFRQRQRRTQHSQKRHLDPQRPAASALSDALQAKKDSIYRDVQEDTWVVIGPKNRVHVFNDSAVHITSVVYSGETVQQRTTRGKWLVPRPEELAAFQEALDHRAREE